MGDSTQVVMGSFNPAVFQLSRILMWSIVYGIYSGLAGVTLYLLLRYGSTYSGRLVVVIYTVFMSVVVTGWYAASVAIAFRVLEGKAVANAAGSLDLRIPQATFVVLRFLGGDALLLYRVILIWKRDLRVAIPLTVTYAALTGFGISSYTVRKNGAFADNPVYDAYMTTFLVFNMIVPVLMAHKLWRTTQEHARGTASSMHVRGTLHLLVQTALVWAVTAAAYAVSEWVDAVPVPVKQVVSDTAQHLVALVPAAIIFDVALREYRQAAAAQAGQKMALSAIRLRTLSPISPAESSTSPYPYGSSVDRHACVDFV